MLGSSEWKPWVPRRVVLEAPRRAASCLPGESRPVTSAQGARPSVPTGHPGLPACSESGLGVCSPVLSAQRFLRSFPAALGLHAQLPGPPAKLGRDVQGQGRLDPQWPRSEGWRGVPSAQTGFHERALPGAPECRTVSLCGTPRGSGRLPGCQERSRAASCGLPRSPVQTLPAARARRPLLPLPVRPCALSVLPSELPARPPSRPGGNAEAGASCHPPGGGCGGPAPCPPCGEVEPTPLAGPLWYALVLASRVT